MTKIDRSRLVSEHLSSAEAAEAVRRLDKGGTGVRQERRPISATVEKVRGSSFGYAVFVKDERDAPAARELLEDEGWPVVGTWDEN